MDLRSGRDSEPQTSTTQPSSQPRIRDSPEEPTPSPADRGQLFSRRFAQAVFYIHFLWYIPNLLLTPTILIAWSGNACEPPKDRAQAGSLRVFLIISCVCALLDLPRIPVRTLCDHSERWRENIFVRMAMPSWTLLWVFMPIWLLTGTNWVAEAAKGDATQCQTTNPQMFWGAVAVIAAEWTCVAMWLAALITYMMLAPRETWQDETEGGTVMTPDGQFWESVDLEEVYRRRRGIDGLSREEIEELRTYVFLGKGEAPRKLEKATVKRGGEKVDGASRKHEGDDVEDEIIQVVVEDVAMEDVAVEDVAAVSPSPSHPLSLQTLDKPRRSSSPCDPLPASPSSVTLASSHSLPTETADTTTNAPTHTSTDAHFCAICLSEYKRGETLIELPCSHRFHAKCGRRWLKPYEYGGEGRRTCPLCNRVVAGKDRCQVEE
ncbi:hypothetical protein HK104_008607 [Borealophlyctis nickersoniae]|nr:hypothetical protein HK104_008607 [Borealophlyctis nickersoniae]